ncbi:olfactory receptor 2T12-like [Odocoileus virginianus]|uniref:Olfactory receptor n=1 Tax=Odocoileus virginianus TaxID=9874 RepID=A0ABM4HE77_ODOVR
MENTNDTTGINFILLGLLNYTQTHIFFFSVVLMTFLTSLISNIFMIMLIHMDSRLCTPMYFLLSQLSLMDVILVLTVVPKMVSNYLMYIRSISPAGCGVQIFLFVTLEGGECFLLAAMAYDRYVAVCHPLTYLVLMNQKLCLHMTDGSWLLGGVDGLMQSGVTLSFPYCHPREINHFFCEAPSLVRLACTDTMIFEFFMYVCCVLMLLIPVSFILAFYGLILITVLCMHSAAARKKTFATCSSHLAVVGVFYGTIIFIYMRPKSYRSVAHDKVVSAFYTIFTPVLNPLIYSVRNKEVKGALRKWRNIFSDLYSEHCWHNDITQIRFTFCFVSVCFGSIYFAFMFPVCINLKNII